MTTLKITDDDIPCLEEKVAIITGGASGIGFATARILALRGAKVYMLDLNPPDEQVPTGAEYVYCNITSWSELVAIFKRIGHVDICIANAGVSEETDYFKDTFDDTDNLIEPKYAVLEVNFKAVLNFVKLSLSYLRKQGTGGSIVITSSATAYAPEQSLPVYSATKLGLIGLVRALRPIVPLSDITINAVAPAATITKLLPKDLATPIIAAGLPVSSAHHVGLAVAYSAIAKETCRVESYGKDTEELATAPGRWNGRTILTLGDSYTEIEEPTAKLRLQWFGEYPTSMTRFQQTVTDFRGESV